MPQIDLSATIVLTLQKLFAADVSSTSALAVPSPTTTAPSGDGVIPLLNGPIGGAAPDLMKLFFVGKGSGATANATITLWHVAQDTANRTPIYVPTTVATLALTTGAKTGVASSVIDSSLNLVTTIAGTLYTAANEIISPGDGSLACLKLDPVGAVFAQLQLQAGSGSNPFNAFWAGY